MLVTVADYSRFIALRQRVIDEVNRQREKGEPGKSADGTFTISFTIEMDGEMHWNIYLYCYLIGPGRHYEWHGATFLEALRKAEKQINEWIREELERDESDD